MLDNLPIELLENMVINLSYDKLSPILFCSKRLYNNILLIRHNKLLIYK